LYVDDRDLNTVCKHWTGVLNEMPLVDYASNSAMHKLLSSPVSFSAYTESDSADSKPALDAGDELHIREESDSVSDDDSYERKESSIPVMVPAATCSNSPETVAAMCKLNTRMSVASTPPPTLPVEMWGEPDPSTFRLRGSTYNQDKVKIASAPSMFKLLAVDLLEVPDTTRNIASHPRNRVFQALQRGDDTWVFVVNIMVPGPPYISYVAYFEGNRVRI
jgi:hypothetical protein